MSDLYTSQVHLKRLLDGRATSAFTPAPEATLKILDRNFFPGMGALNEDEHGRLQCPVRDCGKWVPSLGQHISKNHSTIGTSGIRQALDIPNSTPLVSRVLRKSRPDRRVAPIRGLSDAGRAKAAAARRGRAKTIAARNWADTCPAQTLEKIEDLAVRLGHSPSFSEAIEALGTKTCSAILEVFGTWNGAKAVCSLLQYGEGHGPLHPSPHNRMAVEDVVLSVGNWRQVHGYFPPATEATRPGLSPRIPTYRAILRALDVDSWDAAIRSIAVRLGVSDVRRSA